MKICGIMNYTITNNTKQTFLNLVEKETTKDLANKIKTDLENLENNNKLNSYDYCEEVEEQTSDKDFGLITESITIDNISIVYYQAISNKHYDVVLFIDKYFTIERCDEYYSLIDEIVSLSIHSNNESDCVKFIEYLEENKISKHTKRSLMSCGKTKNQDILEYFIKTNSPFIGFAFMSSCYVSNIKVLETLHKYNIYIKNSLLKSITTLNMDFVKFIIEKYPRNFYESELTDIKKIEKSFGVVPIIDYLLSKNVI